MSWQMVLAPFGVFFIVLLTWFFGGLKQAPSLDQSSARNRLSQDFPDCLPVSCDLTVSGASALMESADGSIGMVIATGDRLTTRRWAKGDIEDAHTQDNTLVVSTP